MCAIILSETYKCSNHVNILIDHTEGCKNAQIFHKLYSKKDECLQVGNWLGQVMFLKTGVHQHISSWETLN